MPDRPLIACAYPGCPNRTKHRRCDEHRSKQSKYSGMKPETVDSAKFYRTVEWQRIRKAKLRMNPFCQFDLGNGRTCMRRTAMMHVDHIKSLSRGGTNDLSNLQTLCHNHHSKKTATFDAGFGNRRKRYAT